MATTAGVNVLRYSALGAGVVYGFYHQRTITASTKKAEARREYEHKQELIQKAKDEYTKSKQPASSTQSSGGIKQDPMSPNFDMEAFMNALMQQKS